MLKKRVFTLIELLITISIIAILCAILLPALNKARAAGQRIACTNNMKTMGIAHEMYSAANDGYIVFAYAEFDGGYYSWDDMLGDYDGRALSDENKKRNAFYGSEYIAPLYRCPSYPMWHGKNTDGTDNKTVTRSYTINGVNVTDETFSGNCGIAYKKDDKTICSLKINRVREPTKVIFLAELPTTANYLGNTSTVLISNRYDQMQANVYTHSKKLNYLFCDGHVALYSPVAVRLLWNRY